jgi:hypothetical protein
MSENGGDLFGANRTFADFEDERSELHVSTFWRCQTWMYSLLAPTMQIVLKGCANKLLKVHNSSRATVLNMSQRIWENHHLSLAHLSFEGMISSRTSRTEKATYKCSISILT